jgi:hypothetical protein
VPRLNEILPVTCIFQCLCIRDAHLKLAAPGVVIPSFRA